VTFVILFVLAVLWTAYGVMVWRSRAERRNVNSISSFAQHLNVLERTSPNRVHLESDQGYIVPTGSPSTLVAAPQTLREAQRRRRDLLAGLGTLALANVLLGGLVGGIFVATAAVALGLFGAYVLLLARSQQIEAQPSAEVRYLPASRPTADAVELDGDFGYLRSAN
jgi:TRAP-type mannitol/chloroaromatic compound transport system permease large subunit